MNQKVTPEVKRLAIELFATGIGSRAVAKALGIARSTLLSWPRSDAAYALDAALAARRGRLKRAKRAVAIAMQAKREAQP